MSRCRHSQVETVTYDSYAENIIAYREAEDFLTPVVGNSNIYNRCSDTSGGYARSYVDVTTVLPSGAYRITAGSYANTSTSFTFRAGNNDVFTQTGYGMWQKVTGSTFQVADGQTIQVIGGSNNYALDYVYVQAVFAYATASSNRTYGQTKKPSLINPANAAVTYSSDNVAVATVNANGGITFVRNGTATITARATIDGVEYTTTHTVYVTGQSTNTSAIVYDSSTKTDSYGVGAYTSGDDRYLNEEIDGTSISIGYGSTSETQMALGGYNGKLTVGGRIANADGSNTPRGLIRLADADGNVLEKKSLDTDYTSITFNTLLMGGSTYYVYAETTAMRKSGSSAGNIDYADNDVYSTFQLTNFSFAQMEGTTVNLIDQSLFFFPNNNANSNRLDRTIPGFDITFGGGDGAKYQNNGTFIFRNKDANSETENGSITISPRVKAVTGNASDVIITSVTLNTGSEAVGSPSVYINGVDKGAVTANSTLVYIR